MFVCQNAAKVSVSTLLRFKMMYQIIILDDEKSFELSLQIIVFEFNFQAHVSIVKNKKQVPSHIRKILKPFEWKEPMES